MGAHNTSDSDALATRHTPGPWTVCPFEEGLFPHVHLGPVRLYDYGRGEQCTSYLTINEGPSPEMVEKYHKTGNDSNLCGTTTATCRANARLIAAAPDMLAALKAADEIIADQIERFHKDCRCKVCESLPYIIDAAIRKAERGQ